MGKNDVTNGSTLPAPSRSPSSTMFLSYVQAVCGPCAGVSSDGGGASDAKKNCSLSDVAGARDEGTEVETVQKNDGKGEGTVQMDGKVPEERVPELTYFPDLREVDFTMRPK